MYQIEIKNESKGQHFISGVVGFIEILTNVKNNHHIWLIMN
jgi:hypothetical protein